jgi:hypothetical protein
MFDDFEYPMPQRATNWTLPNENRRRAADRPPRPINQTQDISGASTGTTALYRSTQFTHKPSLYNPADIAGAAPKQQIPKEVRKPNDRNLKNEDIEHSFPESKLFSTPRTVDPLYPVYKLPDVHKRLPTPPVQKHETMKVHDIEGTSPKPLWKRSEVRNPLDYSDIPLSHAGGRAELRKRQTESKALVTEDITTQYKRVTSRHVSPLDPAYSVPGPVPGRTETVGGILGSHPKQPPPLRSDRPLLSLRSEDIDGCKPGSHVPYPAESRRREWKKTCDISDIDIGRGAHCTKKTKAAS